MRLAMRAQHPSRPSPHGRVIWTVRRLGALSADHPRIRVSPGGKTIEEVRFDVDPEPDYGAVDLDTLPAPDDGPPRGGRPAPPRR